MTFGDTVLKLTFFRRYYQGTNRYYYLRYYYLSQISLRNCDVQHRGRAVRRRARSSRQVRARGVCMCKEIFTLHGGGSIAFQERQPNLRGLPKQ